jgi:hypothetical protein
MPHSFPKGLAVESHWHGTRIFQEPSGSSLHGQILPRPWQGKV